MGTLRIYGFYVGVKSQILQSHHLMTTTELLNPAALDGCVGATRGPRERATARNDAAVCIQKSFRGWRTRRRVVWCVREELSAFMAAIEQDVEVERLLLGLPKPQTSRWLSEDTDPQLAGDFGAAGGVKKTLHLPRIEDDVLGLRFSFPPPPPRQELERQSSHAEAHDHANGDTKDAHGVVDALENGVELDHSFGTSAPPPLELMVETLPHDENLEPAQLSEIQANHAELAVDCCDPVALDDGLLVSSPHSLAASRSDQGSAVEVEGSPATPHNNTPTVDQILASHSKADILMELEWARQALHDRLRYLDARQRSQR